MRMGRRLRVNRPHYVDIYVELPSAGARVPSYGGQLQDLRVLVTRWPLYVHKDIRSLLRLNVLV